jgi:hypothetical protein
MNEMDAGETARWRLDDSDIQGLTSCRQRRAQAVIDVGESAKRLARQRGTNPLDDLLELYIRVMSAGAKLMVADALAYVKAELDLVKPFRNGGIAFDSLSRRASGSRLS